MPTDSKWTVEILTRAELDALLRACNRRSPSGLRDRALIALLYGSGLRIAEALALRPRDVGLDAGTLRVHNGKGGKARTSAIESGMAAIVREWLDHRRDALGLNGTAPLFCQISNGEKIGNRVGLPVSQACVRQMLRRRTARAGIEKRVHCHGFRHSHAANLAAAGTPVNVVQAQLGHASLATTSRYLAHVQPADVVAAVRRLG
jgi:site-specific recombinase XerD